MNTKCLFALAGLLIIQPSKAQNYRYSQDVFEDIIRISDVVYATVPSLNSPYLDESNTTMKDLEMDLYLPDGDQLTQRPSIIFAHGGGFVAGERSVDDMQAFCTLFAKKGYVTATIDYRQGVEVVDNGDLHYTRAAYRGLQDGKAAVRFLRAHAEEYGIDPQKVYWGGNSAGSFIGLFSIFLDNNEKPVHAGIVDYNIGFLSYSGPDLGMPDYGENLHYNGRPDALMACWGGISTPDIIQKENKQSVFLVHGTDDEIVPFEYGKPFNLQNISPVYGSSPIHQKLTELNLLQCDPYFVEGVGHEFYGVLNGVWIDGQGGNAYWDTIVGKATQFFWQQHKPVAEILYEIDGLSVSFEHTEENAIAWQWDFGDGYVSEEPYPVHQYSENGSYRVKLYLENQIYSWDTTSQIITLSSVSSGYIIDGQSPAIYPNPVRDQISVVLPAQFTSIEIALFNSTGKLVYHETRSENDSQTILVSHLQTGLYYLRISNGQHTKVYPIVKL